MKTKLILCSLVFFSCVKKDPEPVPVPVPEKSEWLYTSRTTGFIDRDKSTSALECDTAQFFVNGALYSNTCSQYNTLLKAGDKVSFYYSGDIPKTSAPGDFAIWRNENQLPEASMQRFNAITKIFTKDSVMYRDSITVAQDTVHYTVDTNFVYRVWAKISGSLSVQ